MYLFDEKFRLILDFVDKVIWCPHICLCLAEAHQRPLGNTFRHRCLADHEDVFDNGLVPYRLLFFKRFGRNGAVLQSGAVNAISHVKRVQARLGIDFKDAAVRSEHFFRHLAVVDEVRLVNSMLIILVKKAVASQTVAEVHVHHTPRSKHRFLVGITERAEDVRNAPDALLHTQLVSRFRHRTDALTCGTEDIRVVVFLECVELLLAHPFGHELLP